MKSLEKEKNRTQNEGKIQKGRTIQENGRKTKEREEKLKKSSGLCHERRRKIKRGCDLWTEGAKEYIYIYIFFFSKLRVGMVIRWIRHCCFPLKPFLFFLFSFSFLLPLYGGYLLLGWFVVRIILVILLQMIELFCCHLGWIILITLFWAIFLLKGPKNIVSRGPKIIWVGAINLL